MHDPSGEKPSDASTSRPVSAQISERHAPRRLVARGRTPVGISLALGRDDVFRARPPDVSTSDAPRAPSRRARAARAARVARGRPSPRRDVAPRSTTLKAHNARPNWAEASRAALRPFYGSSTHPATCKTRINAKSAKKAYQSFKIRFLRALCGLGRFGRACDTSPVRLWALGYLLRPFGSGASPARLLDCGSPNYFRPIGPIRPFGQNTSLNTGLYPSRGIPSHPKRCEVLGFCGRVGSPNPRTDSYCAPGESSDEPGKPGNRGIFRISWCRPRLLPAPPSIIQPLGISLFSLRMYRRVHFNIIGLQTHKLHCPRHLWTFVPSHLPVSVAR